MNDKQNVLYMMDYHKLCKVVFIINVNENENVLCVHVFVLMIAIVSCKIPR